MTMTPTEFQTNPRGVGGARRRSSRPRTRVSDQPSWGRRIPATKQLWSKLPFQTNPRGVGGNKTRRRLIPLPGFRPTLVGSEDEQPQVYGLPRWFQTNPRGVGGVTTANTRPKPSVSDQPSWGRRRTCRASRGTTAGFRPTLVGSEGPLQ